MKGDVHLGIVGSGRVGKAFGKAVASKGYKVLFYDIKIEQLTPLVQLGYRITMDIRVIKRECTLIAIAVPTEALPNGDCDLSILESVVKQLSDYDGLILQVSTCPPFTARKMSKITEATYAVHPSFYSMARMEYDALHPVKILLGTKDGKPIPILTELFSSFDSPIYYNTWETVELAKYADNCLSACLISYWNDIYNIAKKLGVDSDWIARTVDTDPLYRTVYRWHGKAYGGFCLPKDVLALRNWSQKEIGYLPKVINAVHELNEEMREKHGESEKHFLYRP